MRVAAPVPPFGTVRAFPNVSVPRVASWEKRLVELAVVEKRLVVVAFARVVLPVTERILRYEFPETESAVVLAYAI